MKRTCISLLAAVAALVILVACAQEQKTPVTVDTRAQDEAAIRAASAAWSKAATAKDIETCVSVYAQDAERLPDGAPAIIGKESIRKEWTALLATPGEGLSWTTKKIEIARSGEVAYETGPYEFKMLDKKDKPMTQKGKFLIVWKKQASGSWKVVADIDNRDQ
jgi:uncharacterized protein (TIGR02246 family)